MRWAQSGHDVTVITCIPNLPAGNYRVTAWHERVDSVETRIAISAGENVNLDLSIPRPEQNEQGAP